MYPFGSPYCTEVMKCNFFLWFFQFPFIFHPTFQLLSFMFCVCFMLFLCNRFHCYTFLLFRNWIHIKNEFRVFFVLIVREIGSFNWRKINFFGGSFVWVQGVGITLGDHVELGTFLFCLILYGKSIQLLMWSFS